MGVEGVDEEGKEGCVREMATGGKRGGREEENIQMERKEGKEDGEREGLVDEVRIKEEAVDLLELSVEL